MEVSVTELRANLKEWLDRVRGGHEVVITERGLPIARITAVGQDERIEALTKAGILAPAQRPKGKARRSKVKLRGGVSILDYLER
jgi:prevent-host-death family protein